MAITKPKAKHIEELHFEHRLWTKEVGFYKDELLVFNIRLEEISKQYVHRQHSISQP